MSRNTRGTRAREPIEVSPKEVRDLMAKYDEDRHSCKVQKLGLHKVTDALVASGASGTLVHQILTDRDGKYKADISDTPVTEHVKKRCACFRKGAR